MFWAPAALTTTGARTRAPFASTTPVARDPSSSIRATGARTKTSPPAARIGSSIARAIAALPPTGYQAPVRKCSNSTARRKNGGRAVESASSSALGVSTACRSLSSRTSPSTTSRAGRSAWGGTAVARRTRASRRTTGPVSRPRASVGNTARHRPINSNSASMPACSAGKRAIRPAR